MSVSGEHPKKLLSFCAANRKPFFLLMPHWVYTKEYYETALGATTATATTATTPTSPPSSSSSSSSSGVPAVPAAAASSRPSKGIEPFYLVPMTRRYAYTPPSWVVAGQGSTAVARLKQTTSPFPSFWYCHAPAAVKKPLLRWWFLRLGGAGKGGKGGKGSKGGKVEEEGAMTPSKRLIMAQQVVLSTCIAELPQEVRGELDTTKRRPNARTRKKMAKRRQQMQRAQTR